MLKVIPVDQIQVGMFISEQNAEWIPEQNRTKSGLILREETIGKIRQRGIDFVTIDTDRGIDVPDYPDQPSDMDREEMGRRNFRQQEQSGVASPSVSLEDERTRAERIHSQALGLLDDVMDRVREGAHIDVAEVESVAEGLVDSVFRNENALACLSRIRNKDAYLMEHSLNVGVLLSILAKSMGFDVGTIRKLAVGGMLHDIGKVQVPDEVLHKPGKLEAEEWEEMKRHVTYGEAYLQQIAVDSTVRNICAHHHERLDSSGYPRGLGGDAVSLCGRWNLPDWISTSRLWILSDFWLAAGSINTRFQPGCYGQPQFFGLLQKILLPLTFKRQRFLYPLPAQPGDDTFHCPASAGAIQSSPNKKCAGQSLLFFQQRVITAIKKVF